MFIGYYNLANFITLTGMASSVVACLLAISGNIQVAVMLLMLSGVCDCFDGPVARMDKDRSPAEKVFGVQIDTVSDMVSFGVTPAVILFSLGRNRILPIFAGGPVIVILVSVVLIFYVLCLLSVTVPIPGRIISIVLVAVYFVTAILFISNFKMKKPTGFVYFLYPVYEIVLVVLYVIFGGRLNG